VMDGVSSPSALEPLMRFARVDDFSDILLTTRLSKY
jgi:hypothetical protein